MLEHDGFTSDGQTRTDFTVGVERERDGFTSDGDGLVNIKMFDRNRKIRQKEDERLNNMVDIEEGTRLWPKGEVMEQLLSEKPQQWLHDEI